MKGVFLEATAFAGAPRARPGAKPRTGRRHAPYRPTENPVPASGMSHTGRRHGSHRQTANPYRPMEAPGRRKPHRPAETPGRQQTRRPAEIPDRQKTRRQTARPTPTDGRWRKSSNSQTRYEYRPPPVFGHRVTHLRPIAYTQPSRSAAALIRHVQPSRSSAERDAGDEFARRPRNRVREPQGAGDQLKRLGEIVVRAGLDAGVEVVANDG